MKQQTENDIEYTFSENDLNKVCVFKMDVEEFTGKQKTDNVYGKKKRQDFIFNC